jgi:hypothetical protein
MTREPALFPDEDAERQGGLYVTAAELKRRLGLPEKEARRALKLLEEDPRFPRPDPDMGNRRFWPAVLRYLYRKHGIIQDEGKHGQAAGASGPRSARAEMAGTR